MAVKTETEGERDQMHLQHIYNKEEWTAILRQIISFTVTTVRCQNDSNSSRASAISSTTLLPHVRAIEARQNYSCGLRATTPLQRVVNWSRLASANRPHIRICVTKSLARARGMIHRARIFTHRSQQFGVLEP